MIGFVLVDGESAFEEKRRFYQGQIRRLGAEGVNAALYEFSEAEPVLPGVGAVAVFDIECRRFLRRHLDDRGILHAPLIWNPYRFFKVGQDWVCGSELVIAVLAPGFSAGQMLSKFALGKSVETLNVSGEYPDRRDARLQLSESLTPLRIGVLGESGVTEAFVLGIVARNLADFAEYELFRMDFGEPGSWRDDLMRCDVLISLRGLCGTGLPLLDAMASGVVVAGTHGGGLRDVACPENGIWVNRATLEIFAEELVAGIKRLASDPDWYRALVDQAVQTARDNSADATFGTNLEVWKRLLQRASSVR